MTTQDAGRTLWINGDRDPGHTYQVRDPQIDMDLEQAMQQGTVLKIAVTDGTLYLNCKLVTQAVISDPFPDTTQGLH
jgi:hypothetical protein